MKKITYQTRLGYLKYLLHKKIDWLWKEGGMTRDDVYKMLTRFLSGEGAKKIVHISSLTEGEAEKLWEYIKNI